MGRTDTEEYQNWEDGLNIGINCCIDIIRKSRRLDKITKKKLIEKMEKEK